MLDSKIDSLLVRPCPSCTRLSTDDAAAISPTGRQGCRFGNRVREPAALRLARPAHQSVSAEWSSRSPQNPVWTVTASDLAALSETSGPIHVEASRFAVRSIREF